MSAANQNYLFYDGNCGLCHRWVRFVLKRDINSLFKLSPLQGETIKTIIPEQTRRNLPDSIVVSTNDKQVLIKTQAVIYILKNLPGAWPTLAAFLSVIPKPLSDLGYDCVARVRLKLFRKPDELCPIVPVELRERFVE